VSLLGAIIAGLVATSLVTVTTRLTTMNEMGFEKFFATMFSPRANMKLGFALHYALGVILALIYAGLWLVDIGWPSYLYGLIFGIVQWLVVGSLVAAFPFVHVGIRSGVVRAPGVYMTKLLGKWAFLGGLVNHVIFGLAIAYFYQFFWDRYS
jgi:hypothetical protein